MWFLNNFEYLLKKNNVKKSELAKAIGISQAAISNWYKRGTDNVTLSILNDISKYFKITLDDLVNKDLSKEEKTLMFSSAEYKECELQVIQEFALFLDKYKKELELQIIMKN